MPLEIRRRGGDTDNDRRVDSAKRPLAPASFAPGVNLGQPKNSSTSVLRRYVDAMKPRVLSVHPSFQQVFAIRVGV